MGDSMSVWPENVLTLLKITYLGTPKEGILVKIHKFSLDQALNFHLEATAARDTQNRQSVWLSEPEVFRNEESTPFRDELDITEVWIPHPFLLRQRNSGHIKRHSHILLEDISCGELDRLYVDEIVRVIDFPHNAGVIDRDLAKAPKQYVAHFNIGALILSHSSPMSSPNASEKAANDGQIEPVRAITLRRTINIDPTTGAEIIETIDTDHGGETKTLQRNLLFPAHASQTCMQYLTLDEKQALLEREAYRLFCQGSNQQVNRSCTLTERQQKELERAERAMKEEHEKIVQAQAVRLYHRGISNIRRQNEDSDSDDDTPKSRRTKW